MEFPKPSYNTFNYPSALLHITMTLVNSYINYVTKIFHFLKEKNQAMCFKQQNLQEDILFCKMEICMKQPFHVK